MSELSTRRIAFNVETERVLQILSSEIYDSPQAFLRENVQNAYDAILMRCTAQSLQIKDCKIQVSVGDGVLSVQDDGIGMTEEVLRKNFWHAGSSGKKSELASKAGVIGTFGIGAMANFGVCTELEVKTRSIDSVLTVISNAKRADLRIGEDCIDLRQIEDGRDCGTVITAKLDPKYSTNEQTAAEYLRQYVRFLPVPVFVNGKIISQEKFEKAIGENAEEFKQSASKTVTNGQLSCDLRVFFNFQARVLIRATNFSLNGAPVQGEALFIQSSGMIMGFRNLFGLAPIPVQGAYNWGGFLNLAVLSPTAGREALSQESVNLVARLVSLIEAEVSKDMAETDYADKNQQFQNYIFSHNQIPSAKNVCITLLSGESKEVRLGEVKNLEPDKQKFFYPGRDATIQKQFSGADVNLFLVSQNQPRRNIQLRFLKEISGIKEIPEEVIVKPIPQTELTFEEGMFLLHLKSILLDDYFMPDVDIAFSEISHGLPLHVECPGESIQISISRPMPAARMVIEAYDSAREVFHGFAVDFVREHIYPKIRHRVPSSTQQGRDALYRRLKENEELFRYDLSDFGDMESILSDYLSGKADLQAIFQASAEKNIGQEQRVQATQVGAVENELPGITDRANGDFDVVLIDPYVAYPPILRSDVESEMKILTIESAHPKLNNFQMFLSLSDKMVKREGDFLHQPHTTKLMWGSHRVIYVFTNPTGELHLYYDIKLKEPLETKDTGGDMVPTTTIVTKNRIFVPVPKNLESAFRISNGSKEFFVRFDAIL